MRGLTAALALLGVVFFSLLTWYTGNEPWFDPLLSIDGQSYAQGMTEIGARHEFFKLNDLYHSPGYQLYLGGLYALWGPRGIFRLFKALAWLMAIGCMAMVYRIGESWGRYVGVLSAILLAFSSKWAAYMNLLQYEILLAFFLTALAFALSDLTSDEIDRASPFGANDTSPRRKPGPRRQVSVWIPAFAGMTIKRFRSSRFFYPALAAVCLCAACFIHFRMLLLVPLVGWSFWKQRGELAPLLLIVLLPISAAGAWSAYQSARLRRLIVIQDMKPWSDQFRMHNNPKAQGYAFPYVDAVEPSGATFVLRRPFRYAWLIQERFLYLWDFRKDVWYIGPPASPTDIILRLAACLLFFGGLAIKFREDLRAKQFWSDSVVYFIVAVALAGPLLSTGSSRFLVPLLPLVCLFQAYASMALVSRFLTPTRRKAWGLML